MVPKKLGRGDASPRPPVPPVVAPLFELISNLSFDSILNLIRLSHLIIDQFYDFIKVARI